MTKINAAVICETVKKLAKSLDASAIPETSSITTGLSKF